MAYILDNKMHKCACKEYVREKCDISAKPPPMRIIRATGISPTATILTPVDISGPAGLARIIYNLPMHPMTSEELAQCERYKPRTRVPDATSPSDDGKGSEDDCEADLYCIVSAAVVYCRLFGKKIRYAMPKPYTTPAQKFRKFVPKHLTPQRDVELIISYIHNHFHEGPQVILAPAEFL